MSSGNRTPIALWRRPEMRLLVLMCLMVAGGEWASTQLSLAVGTVSSIWIANGIVSAFVLAVPERWKIVFFAVGQMVNMGTDLVQGDTLKWALWFAICNSTEVLITVLPLRHFAGRAELSTKRSLQRIVLFGVLLGPLACALLAAPAVQIIEGKPAWEGVRIWFLSDALGGAATLPCLLFLLTRVKGERRDLNSRAEDVVWICLLGGVSLAIFWQTRYPLVFLLFPPLVASLFRFRLPGAIYGTSVVVILAAAFTAEGHGPFALSQSALPTERVLMFQLFGLVVLSSCFPLGFLIDERYRLELQLKQANLKLGNLALLDDLTGVRNRRSFDAIMETEWSTAKANGSELSLLYLDIDFFKRFNDAYGHQVGDDCLRAVAGALMGNVRSMGDCVARYGGEEFVILLPGASAESARATADRMAATILDLKIPHKESPFGVVTASFGIGTVRPSEGGNTYGLIRVADDALYAAKRAGRNRSETRLIPAARG